MTSVWGNGARPAAAAGVGRGGQRPEGQGPGRVARPRGAECSYQRGTGGPPRAWAGPGIAEEKWGGNHGDHAARPSTSPRSWLGRDMLPVSRGHAPSVPWPVNCGAGVQTRPLPAGSGSRELSPGPQLSGPRTAGPAPWTPTRSLWCRFSSSPGRPQKPGTPSPRLGRSGMAIPWDGAVPCDQTWPGRAGQRGTCQRADDIHTQPPLLTR